MSKWNRLFLFYRYILFKNKEITFYSKYHVRDFIIWEQIEQINSIINSDNILSIIKKLDNIQDQYLNFFDNLFVNLKDSVGLTSSKVFDNIKNKFNKSKDGTYNINLSLSISDLYNKFLNYDIMAADIYNNDVFSNYSILNSFCNSLSKNRI